MSGGKVRSLIQTATIVHGVRLLVLLAILSIGYATSLHAANPPVCYISFNLPSFLDEGQLVNGEVTRDPVDGQPLVVTLTSNDTGEATVPTSVTILANEASAIFPITGQPDNLVDGDIDVTISGDGGDYGTDDSIVSVHNTDVSTLTLTPSSQNMSEGAAGASLTIARNTDTTNSLDVTISSSLPNELGGTPYTVTIPALASSKQFTIASYPDELDESDETATVTASAFGFASDQATVLIQDDDATPVFSPSLPTTPEIDENNGYSVTFDVTDADDANPTVSKSGADAGLFSLTQNANDWTLSLNSTPNYEAPLDSGLNNTYEVTVNATDGTNSATPTLVLTVKDVNEDPTITAISDTTINEDGSTGAIIFTLNDVDNTSSQVTVNGTSSNTTLIPNGSVVLSTSGWNRTVTVTPAANENGYSDITLNVSDGAGGSAVEVFRMTVTSVNDVPTISFIGDQTIDEDDQTVVLNFTVSDVETAATGLSVTESSTNTTLVPVGNIDVQGSGSARTVRVTPAANGYGSSVVRLTVSDGTNSSYEEFTVTVTSVNDLPTAVGDAYSVDEDDTLNVLVGSGVLNNDSAGGDGGSLSATQVTGPSNGSLTLVGDGSFTYTPNSNYNGTDSFTYSIADSDGSTDTATVSITVNSVNDLPTAVGDAYSVDEDNTLNVVVANGVLNNDSAGGDGGTLSATKVSDPSNGTLSLNGDGSLSYSPSSNFNGSDTFTYSIADSDGNTDTAAVTITVNSINDLPGITQIVDQMINEDGITGALSFTLSDIESAPANLTVTKASSNLTLIPLDRITLNGTGYPRTVTVQSAAHLNGTATITLTVTDGDGGSTPMSFDVTVNAVNDLPGITQIGNQTINEDGITGALSFTLSDIESAPANLTVSKASSNLTLFPLDRITVSGTGYPRTVTVQPVAQGNGNGTITLTVTDGDGGSTDMGFVVTVNAVNDSPIITTSSSSIINENETFVLMIGATDEEDDPITFSKNGGADTALFSIDPDFGILSFLSGPDYEIPSDANTDNVYEVTVQVSDGISSPTSQTFFVTVNDVLEAQPPTIASIPDLEAPANESFYYPERVVLADPDTTISTLTVTVVSSDTDLLTPSGIEILGNGTERDLRVTPIADATGAVTITLTVSDGIASDQTSFVYSVSPVGIPPADTDGDGLPDYIEDPDGNGSYTSPPDLADPNRSDTDLDGIDDGTEVAAGLNPSLQDSDGDGVLDPIELDNNPPTAVADGFTVDQGSSGISLDVLSNDTTVPDVGEFLVITSVDGTGSQGGTITTNGASLTYATPNGSFLGNETFDYTINDGYGAEATATVTVTVSNINDPPGMTTIANLAMDADATYSPVNYTVSDADGPTTSVTVTAVVDNATLFPIGSIVLSGTDAARSLSLDPATGETGSALVTLTADDGTDQSLTQFVVNVGPQGLPPGDTDGDGLPDYLEDSSGNGVYDLVLGESNWNDPDTDDDLLNDFYEYLLGANPNLSDTDIDGVADFMEALTGRRLLPEDDWSLDQAFDNQVITVQPAHGARLP